MTATKRYRRVARDALEVADRVVFVGPQAGHMDRFRQGEARDRLFTFVTSYQASAFLARAAVAGELIYIKGSLTADHLERIMLSQLDRVVCWRERCGIAVRVHRLQRVPYTQPHPNAVWLTSNRLYSAPSPDQPNLLRSVTIKDDRVTGLSNDAWRTREVCEFYARGGDVEA